MNCPGTCTENWESPKQEMSRDTTSTLQNGTADGESDLPQVSNVSEKQKTTTYSPYCAEQSALIKKPKNAWDRFGSRTTARWLREICYGHGCVLQMYICLPNKVTNTRTIARVIIKIMIKFAYLPTMIFSDQGISC